MALRLMTPATTSQSLARVSSVQRHGRRVATGCGVGMVSRAAYAAAHGWMLRAGALSWRVLWRLLWRALRARAPTPNPDPDPIP